MYSAKMCHVSDVTKKVRIYQRNEFCDRVFRSLTCFFLTSRSEDDHQRTSERREATGRGHDAHDILPHGVRAIRTTSE